jgi:hypothetical protein
MQIGNGFIEWEALIGYQAASPSAVPETGFVFQSLSAGPAMAPINVIPSAISKMGEKKTSTPTAKRGIIDTNFAC